MPKANMFMPIFATGKFLFTVVEMEGLHLFQTNQLIECFPDIVV